MFCTGYYTESMRFVGRMCFKGCIYGFCMAFYKGLRLKGLCFWEARGSRS